MSLCALRALQNKLLTCDTLVSIGVITQNQSVLCESGMENRDHLFFNCPFSSYIWALCKLKLGMPGAAKHTLLEEASDIQNVFKGRSRQSALARTVFRAVVWHLWRERNSRVFHQQVTHKVVCLESFMRMCIYCCSFAIGHLNQIKIFCVTGARLGKACI